MNICTIKYNIFCWIEINIFIIKLEILIDLFLAQDLAHLGYERQGQVEVPGEFAVRGGILDVFLMKQYTFSFHSLPVEVLLLLYLALRQIPQLEQVQPFVFVRYSWKCDCGTKT